MCTYGRLSSLRIFASATLRSIRRLDTLRYKEKKSGCFRRRLSGSAQVDKQPLCSCHCANVWYMPAR